MVLKKRPNRELNPELLQERGVSFVACRNTMRERGLLQEDLLPGVTTVPAGTLEVIRKQHEGYAYFKP
jgi:intracellular sulfur oxidation DsrE/DsrF family protein